MKRIVLGTSAAAIALAAAGAATAGSPTGVAPYSAGAPDPVSINMSTRVAQGMMGSAAATPSYDPEVIGCSTSFSPGRYPQWNIYCYAHDSGTQSASCTSDSNLLAQVLAAMTPDAEINFTWNTSGECTGITVTAQSQNQPL